MTDEIVWQSKTAHQVQSWLGYLTLSELEYLIEIAKEAQPGAHFINIGAGGGTSGLAFMESNPDIKVTTIDIQKESNPRGCLEGEWAVLEAAELVPSERFKQIHGDSSEVAKDWDGGKVDVVFVDGAHTYEGAYNDIKGWLRHLKTGGVMIVHDWHKYEHYAEMYPEHKDRTKEWLVSASKTFPGIEDAVDELLMGKHTFIRRVDAMGVFKKKAQRRASRKKRK